MPSIRIWTVESDNDAKAVKCLAQKLSEYLKLGSISIDITGRLKHPTQLRTAIQNFLKDEDCVILIVDQDGPMTHQKRLQEPNSLINQIKRVVNENRFAGKVFLVEAVRELEAWLLIDFIGIFCYHATKRAQFKEDCRDKMSADPSLKRFVSNNQKGDTETIVEPVSGGKGAKEYLIEFSERVLRVLNPNLTQKNIDREKYHETRSHEVAEYIEITRETLRRNNSLKQLGDVIAQLQ